MSVGGAASTICNRLSSNSLGTLTGSADTENPYPVSGGGGEPVALSRERERAASHAAN